MFKVGDRIKLKSEPKYPFREIIDIKDGAYYFDAAVHLPFKEQDKWEVEQKPAEWSDTDDIGWDEAFACVIRAEKAAKNEEELQNAVTAENWLKEIKFKYYANPVKR